MSLAEVEFLLGVSSIFLQTKTPEVFVEEYLLETGFVFIRNQGLLLRYSML